MTTLIGKGCIEKKRKCIKQCLYKTIGNRKVTKLSHEYVVRHRFSATDVANDRRLWGDEPLEYCPLCKIEGG